MVSVVIVCFQVAEHKCWVCGLTFECSKNILSHFHPPISFEKSLWEDDKYLKPFMVDDALLHSFMGNDDDDDDDYTETISREEVMREFMNNGDLAGLCGADFEEKMPRLSI